jgi:hypothetical protein
MARVARQNWNLLIGQGESLSHVAAQAEKFRAAPGEAGFGGLDCSPDRIVAARAMYMARSQEQARRDTEAPFMWFKWHNSTSAWIFAVYFARAAQHRKRRR